MSRAEASERLSPDCSLPEGGRPFADPLHTDAFHCFGSP
jgi:hypothetical protein